MGNLRGICFVLILFLAISLVSASSYSIEFNQVQDKVIVKEAIDGKLFDNYTDSKILDKSGNQLYFVKRIKFNQSFSEVQIKLNLDKGIVVKDNLVFPAGYNIESDGQTISIVWNIQDVVSGQDFAMFVTLEDTKVNYSLAYWIMGIVILAIIGFFVYKKFVKKEKKKIVKVQEKTSNKKDKEDYNYLLDTEKKVIEELKKADRNELWQKQIQNITGFSKAKVSRLIRNLEARGLIRKIPFGNTNKIRLK